MLRHNSAWFMHAEAYEHVVHAWQDTVVTQQRHMCTWALVGIPYCSLCIKAFFRRASMHACRIAEAYVLLTQRLRVACTFLGALLRSLLSEHARCIFLASVPICKLVWETFRVFSTLYTCAK